MTSISLDFSNIRAFTAAYAKKKLMKILKGNLCISYQQWDLNRLLTILVTHQENSKLYTTYSEFKTFTFQRMLKETEKITGYWPGILTYRDLDMMIKLWFWKKVEKRYGYKAQSFYKISSFRLTTKNKTYSREIN